MIMKTKRGMKMKKAIGYTRVSTSEQALEGISLDNQSAKIKAYCDLNDIELVSIIEDAGKSGKNLNREGMRELLPIIRSKSVDTLIVYKLDRLSRRVLDTLNIIEALEKAGITFHSLNERIDTSTAMGRFFLNITASLAQMERDQISERTKDALQMKISNNERAGQIPFGYRLAEDGNTLLPVPEEQKVIVAIKELHSQGMGYRAICRELEAIGQGKKWHPQTVKNILKRAA
jgi:DNA invertase Pin-like site-specific DNA recombinase